MDTDTISETEIENFVAILNRDSIPCEFHRPPVASDVTVPCSGEVKWRATYVCGCVELSCQAGYDFAHEPFLPGYDTGCLDCGYNCTDQEWWENQKWRAV